MTIEEFVPLAYSHQIQEGSVTFRAPSNIALVKYWGKKKDQIPANPSISFTLDASATTTTLSYIRLPALAEDFSFELLFEGRPKEDFKPKIKTFFSRVEEYLPFLRQYHLKISTSNSFPHSSGIASSASGMAALALCLMQMEKEMNPSISTIGFNRKASFLARLGSGSACRSIEGNLVQWGQHDDIEGSSDLFGLKYPYPIHKVFNNFHDTILLVDKGQKQVSSTVGHNLMHNHPFADARFDLANRNLSRIKEILASGNLKEFIEVIESEALILHAMMLTSIPYFILMKPNTLEIINKIWAFRKSSDTHLCFTLDAGANVHVLYPEGEKKEVYQFIKDELVAFCENGQYICDRIGFGAKKV